nr:MAG TPA_asm: hypothetical protein [Caudoviricetes sp.]DAW21516.1 MAG TPA: hypothetical protein [Caudoviricetes sp.]
MTARNRLEVAYQCIAKLRTLRISSAHSPRN